MPDFTKISGQQIRQGTIPTESIQNFDTAVSRSAVLAGFNTASLLLGSVVSASFATTASFASTASSVNILNQTVSASGDIIAQSNLISRFSAGDEGGEINLSRPQTNTSISGSVVIDVNGNRLRIFESNLPNRGGYWDITTLGTGVGTNLAGGAGTVTSVTAGDGLTGGTITGAGTITVDTGSAHFITGSIGVLNLRGVISSSTQINTGSFSGSFTGTLLGTSSWANNVTSASFATTSSAATSITFTPATASFASNAGLLNGLSSTVFSTTGSNGFNGNQNITGSLIVSGTVTNLLTVLGAATPTLTVQGNTSPTFNIQGNGGTGSFTVGADVNIGSVSNNTFGLLQNNTVAWYISTAKHFIPNANNSYDIGLTNSRVRTVWTTNISSSTPISSASFATTASFTTTSSAATSITFTPSTASFATTASFALNAGGSGFPYDGRTTPAVISGSLIISGSTTQGLFVTGSTTVLGAFQATTKSFKIDHQTLLGKKLIYGVLEGPEHGVYVRGRLKNGHVITLPDEWEWLVDEESITVQLTPIGKTQQLYVSEIADNCVIIRNTVDTLDIDCFYFIQATRKDVPMLDTVQ